MIDREKVMTWLKICGENMDCSGCCPYLEVNKEKFTFECMMALMRDALELLKEQPEPKAAHWVKMKGAMPEYCGHFECDNCGWHGKPLMREIDFAYCPGCGAKMSIDGLHAEDCKKTPFDRMIDDYLEATGGVVNV